MFEQHIVAENMFLKDIVALRDKARHVMHHSPAGQGDDSTTIALLQTVLAAEIVCVLRYTMISISSDGLKNEWIGAEFQEQANDERRHMSLAAARITQLGGAPDFSLQKLAVAAPGAVAGDFAKRVRENLAAEQCVIDHYHELIGFLSQRDPQTCVILTEIVRDEEEHTNDMQDLLVSYIN